MDVRNIQRSGSTYYLYLPTSWCRQNNVTPNTKLVLETNSEGDLIVSPNNKRSEQVNLDLNLPVRDMRIINKFIMAAYINPVKSFNIKLSKEITSLETLDQKRLLSGVEIVKIGGNQISCENLILVDEPDVILKNMIRKIINTLYVMISKGEKELLTRYEEEIDRSNTLISKSVVSALTFKKNSKLHNIELFYIATLSKNLEWFADRLSVFNNNPASLRKFLALMKLLLKTLEEITIETATSLAKETLSIRSYIRKIGKKEGIESVAAALNMTADTIIDWAIIKEIEKKPV